MPAYAQHARVMRPRERAFALAAVVLVQLVLGFVLLTGLRVDLARSADAVQQLIEIALPKPPPPPPPPSIKPALKPAHRTSSAPKAAPKPLGGSPGPQPAHAPPSVTPIVAVHPSAAPSGGGSGTGPALGSGAGGGTGGQGYGDGRGRHRSRAYRRRDIAFRLSAEPRQGGDWRPGHGHVHGAGERPRNCLPRHALQPRARTGRLDLPSHRAALSVPPKHRPLWPADRRRGRLGSRLGPGAVALLRLGDFSLDCPSARVMLVEMALDDLQISGVRAEEESRNDADNRNH